MKNDGFYTRGFYTLVGTLVGSLGALAGTNIAFRAEPSAYVKDVNQDGREDIVTQDTGGKRYVFLQQPNGDYVLSEKVIENLKKSTNMSLDSLEAKLKQVGDQK